MTPLNREKAARKLCELRGVLADDDVMYFDPSRIGNVVPRWQLVAEEIDHIYKILQAINETMEEA